jgi:hypothetical protein
VTRMVGKRGPNGSLLSADQTDAIAQIVGSGRVVDVLVGPAGAGKTTTLGVLRNVWEAENGPGSVIGLAPSAAAAQVLADDLGIGTENTAKWVHAHTHDGWVLQASQLLIVDEASLAGTFSLDTIATHAAVVGAKVLLVGDWAQLSAVDSGGAFGMIARDLGPAAELSDVRRFRNEWEKEATLGLRVGDTSTIDTYMEHGRVVGGGLESMLDAAYTAWRADLKAGRVSVMIAHPPYPATQAGGRPHPRRRGRHRRDPATPAPSRHLAPQRTQSQPTAATAHRRPHPRSHRGDDGGDADGIERTPTAHRTKSCHPRRNSSPGRRIMDNTTRETAYGPAAAEAMASASESYCRIPRPLPHHRGCIPRP